MKIISTKKNVRIISTTNPDITLRLSNSLGPPCPPQRTDLPISGNIATKDNVAMIPPII